VIIAEKTTISTNVPKAAVKGSVKPQSIAKMMTKELITQPFDKPPDSECCELIAIEYVDFLFYFKIVMQITTLHLKLQIKSTSDFIFA
jgi:hypothetical protein